MPANPRVVSAFKAMKEIGISESKTKPVLKKLLKLYEKNWEIIEAEDYRLLADAIFDDEDTKASAANVPDVIEESFEDGTHVNEEPEQPLKRMRKSNENSSNNGLDSNPVKKLKMDSGSISPRSQSNGMGTQPLSPASLSGRVSPTGPLSSDSMSPEMRRSYKGKEPLIPDVGQKEKRQTLERANPILRIREPGGDNRGNVAPPKQKASNVPVLVEPKPEPYTGDDIPQHQVPLAVIRPDSSRRENSFGRSTSTAKNYFQAPLAFRSAPRENGIDILLDSGAKTKNEDAAGDSEEPHTHLEIASLGEVKISLSCNSKLGRQIFHMPSQDEFLKSVQERCLKSYKILDPNFSVKQILKDICECFLELATDSSHESQERLFTLTPKIDLLKQFAARDALGVKGVGGRFFTSNVTGNNHFMNKPGDPGNSSDDGDSRDANSRSLVVVPHYELGPDELRSLHYLNDLTKGEEVVEVPWFNDMNNEYPPSFNYISRSMVFQNAHLDFSLSQIGPENCCPSCLGDCLSSATPCVCANETGRGFAYTSEGLVKEDFLDTCISMTRDPQQQSFSFCQDCPVERSKNDVMIEPCKGHLKRKFIKECWSKCGCHKQCGNRVVQRGIRCKLQVFLTPEGKGWGLRTLEKLPKGAFVCDFVGEIITSKELHERNLQTDGSTGGYPVILDAYWCLKRAVKNEEALCLDTTFHGNIARFINHRCLDANLIEIPVKMETKDHHYYHLAFFTTREVNASEELTWDYGIDFDDNDIPAEVFRCKCGSRFCRNMKRSNRSKLGLRD